MPPPPRVVGAAARSGTSTPHWGQNLASAGIVLRQRGQGSAIEASDGTIGTVGQIVDVGQEAFGIIAVGQHATGVIAIGQSATGVIAIGQIARGGIAIGMVSIGLITIGMATCGILWCGGMLAVGGRVGFSMLGIPLVPKVTEGCTGRGVWWVRLGAGTVVLGGVAVAFWLLVGLPVGEALWGPVGVLR